MSSSHKPETRKLSDLRENPKSTEIYDANDIEDLLESIPLQEDDRNHLGVVGFLCKTRRPRTLKMEDPGN